MKHTLLSEHNGLSNEEHRAHEMCHMCSDLQNSLKHFPYQSTGSTLSLPKQRVFFHRETQPTGKSARITHPGFHSQAQIMEASTGSTLYLPTQRVFFHREAQPTSKSAHITHPGLEAQVLNMTPPQTCTQTDLQTTGQRPRVSQQPGTGSTPFLPKWCVFYNRETQPTGKSACITQPGLIGTGAQRHKQAGRHLGSIWAPFGPSK